ncbi:hypothetical protein F5Y12DRAFT_717778 [Xylaria sp. FL1777]|nr:hypothetical protein F5Y12DRAFT_717778 [Xylaria sp. FL1777]
MASLEALGLASNIIQLVDFVSRLIANARTLYKSAHQTSVGSLVLQDVANDLTRLSDAVIMPNRPGGEGLKQLAQSAKEVANDLLELLDDMQIKGRKTKWKSFLLAVKELRNQDTVTSITSSITRLQTQMTLHLQFQIKDDIASLSQDIQRLQSISDRLQLNNATELKNLRTELRSAFNAINPASDSQRDEQDGCCDKAIILDFQRLAIGDLHTLSQRLPSYASKISTLSRGVESVADDQDIIESFYFDKFTSREEKVPDAHAKTFEWVFRGVLPDGTTKIGFPSWLKSGNGIFWVRGKAGSGKSTLMKFISHHPTTLQYLRCWSGSQQLIMGRFYFWNSGTDLQKSQEGLLRSLIFEILRQCPELASYAKAKLLYTKEQPDSVRVYSVNDATTSPGRSRLELRATGEDWTLRQLTEILESILSHDVSKKFFFIIDGLDEYKAQYNDQELVNSLQKLAASPNVKLCVSSRPWTVFMDAFDGDVGRCLKLEDLTQDDIRSYVTDRFLAHNQYDKLIRMDPNYSSLVDDVTKKSQGVFLWVFLVVRELLEGLTYNDTMNIMRQRLDSFPDSLSRVFQHMLDSVPKVYRSQTAQIFQVAVSYGRPLPMIFYSFLEDVNNNPDLIAQKTHHPLGIPDFPARRDIMRRRLDAWCKGLLEIVGHKSVQGYDYATPEVDFLHRSVRDFLLSGEVAATSEQPNHERLGTWLQFCNAIVLYFRCIPTTERWPKTDPCRRFVYLSERDQIKPLVYFAKMAQKDGADSHTVNKIILDAYDTIDPLISRDTVDRSFVFEAMSSGLKDFVKCKVLSMEKSAISLAMRKSLKCGHSPEMINWFISCTEMKGLSSKVVFEEAFRSFVTAITEWKRKYRVNGDKNLLEITRAISSTGYKLDENFVKTHLPNYYSEFTNGETVSRGTKRPLEEDEAESERKRIHVLD